MSDLSNLEQLIRGKLDAWQEQISEEKHALEERMLQLERRQTNFEATADTLVQTIVRPRMEKLTEFFENAQLLPAINGSHNHCVCSFQHTADYPASVKLDIGVGHDESIENLLLMYHLEIRPIFFRFEGDHQAALSLTQFDTRQVTEWVDERIAEFVDTYLRLGRTEQYQKETLVTDPVCKMRFRKQLETVEATYQGKVYHFCTDHCREKFVADPSRYVSTVGSTPPHPLPGQSHKEELQHEAQELEEIGETIEQLKRKTDARYGAQ